MKRKALISLSMVIVLAAMMIVPASASSGVDKLDEELVRLREIYKNNANAVSQIDAARIQLKDQEIASKVTAELADTITAQINAAVSAAGSATRLSELTEEQRSAIMGYVNNAVAEANAAGIPVAISGDITSGVPQITIGGNRLPAIDNNPIKQTGFDVRIFLIIAAGAFAVLLIAYITLLTLKKKRIYNKNVIRKPESNVF